MKALRQSLTEVALGIRWPDAFPYQSSTGTCRARRPGPTAPDLGRCEFDRARRPASVAVVRRSIWHESGTSPPPRPPGWSPGQETGPISMIVKSPQESYGRGQLPAVAVSRPRHISSPVPSPETTERDGSLLSWGSCRRRAASSGHVTRSVSPGLASTRAAPSYSWISPPDYRRCPIRGRSRSGAGVIGAWWEEPQRSMGLGHASWARAAHGPTRRPPACSSADAAATGYRPLRLNSSRCASNQAMTSLRFQRLCLPIL